MAGVQGYRLFNVVLARKQVLSPSMLSCVFSGEEVRHMKMDAPDQRIKLLFPSLNGTPAALSAEGSWWDQAKAMDAEVRPIARTYTIRRVNVDAGEMEVEFVMHGTEGPASAWAAAAEPGNKLQIVAPNRDHREDSGDRQRIVFEDAKLRLLRHLGRNTNAGIEDVGGRCRAATGADLVETVDHGLGELRPPVEDEGE